jgi:hypothetical protein
LRQALIGIIIFLFLFPNELPAHIFSLYAGTNEEMKETIKINISKTRLMLEYNGEYHGQLAPHIRFMMDLNQDSLVAQNEIAPFMHDYSRQWNDWIRAEMVKIAEKDYNLNFKACKFPAIEKSKMPDPIAFTLVFVIDSLFCFQEKQPTRFQFQIEQRLLFQIGKQFIEMAKARATFTNEQENAIARFCQTKIRSIDSIFFVKTCPGYISRDKREIYGIFFDDTRMRFQFLPYPQITFEATEIID